MPGAGKVIRMWRGSMRTYAMRGLIPVLCIVLAYTHAIETLAGDNNAGRPMPEVMGIGGTPRRGYHAIVKSVGLVKEGDTFRLTFPDGLQCTYRALRITKDEVTFQIEQVERGPERADQEVKPPPDGTPGVVRRRRDPFLPVGCVKELL